MYEIWIKDDPSCTDGVVRDVQCTIRTRDGLWNPMKRSADLELVEWNMRDLVKCNPSIASHYEIRKVASV